MQENILASGHHSPDKLNDKNSAIIAYVRVC